MTDGASKRKTVPENGPEDGFVYAAVEVFSIISPYVFHTHAPRVFSEISAALKRAQEASAEVIAQLNASERARTRERELRSVEVNRHLSQLKELQALLKARADKEADMNRRRTSLERNLAEERSRSAGLEKRLAESADHVRLLQEEFVEAKIALDERWSCALAEAVVTAKEAGRAEVAAKVEASMLKRMRMLSSENSSLKAELRASKVQSANLQETVLSRFQSSDSERTSSLSPGTSSRASGSKFSFASRESSPGGSKLADSPLPPLLPRVPKVATVGEGNTKIATAVVTVVHPDIGVEPEIEMGPEIEVGPKIEARPEIQVGREREESRSGFAEAVMGLTERGSGIAGKVLGFAERGLAILPRVSVAPGEEEGCECGPGLGSRKVAGREAAAPGGIGRGSTPSSNIRVRQLRRIATWAKADAASRRGSDEHDRKSKAMMSSKTGDVCRDEHGVRKRGLGAFPDLAKGPRSRPPSCAGSVDGDSTAAVSGGSLSACSGLLGNEPDDHRPRSFSATSSPLGSFHSGRGNSGGRAGRRWQRSLGAGSNSPSVEALLASGKFHFEGGGHGRGRGAGASAPLPLGPRRRVAGGGVARGTASVGAEDGDVPPALTGEMTTDDPAGVGTAGGVERGTASVGGEDEDVPPASAGEMTTYAPAGVGAGRSLKQFDPLVDVAAAAAADTVGGEGCDDFSAGSAAAADADADAAAAASGDGERVSGEGMNSTDAHSEFEGNGAATRPHTDGGGRGGDRTASDGRSMNKSPRTATARTRSVTITSEVVDVPDAEKSLDELLREMAVIDVEEGFSDVDGDVVGGDDDAWLVEEEGGDSLEVGVDKFAAEAGLAVGVAPLKERGRALCV